MRPFTRAATAATIATALTLIAGCDTTGDPTQGGLFGWSEAKARDRQAEKQSHITGAEAVLSRENAQGAALQRREQTAAGSLASAAAQRTRTEERLHTQHARILAKLDKLDQESPTDATASRARSYRLKVNTIAAQTAISPQQRAERLHVLEAEIDNALARVRE